MTSLEPRPRSRTLIPLLVAVLGIALGAGGLVLVRPFGSGGTERLATAAEKRQAAKPLTSAAIRARIEPSIVDVTATLTYDDETASGTGIVITAPAVGRAGLILTNNHVIRDSTSVTVAVPATGQTYQATLVGVDVTSDIAVLSVSPNAGLASAGLANAPLGNSASVTDGAPVISFGNQAGAGGSPTVAPGVISGTGRTVQADDGAAGFTETLHDMLATTARIEPGDSGGPLASEAGTVIGMDTAAGTGDSATGYAIPIDAAMVAERQITTRQRGQGISLGVGGFLGVIVGSSTTRSPVAQQKQEQSVAAGSAVSSASAACVPTQAGAAMPARIAPVPAGALVVGVLCGTGAAAAGITPGDVITAVGGRQVDSPSALTTIVSSTPPGSVRQVTWVAASGHSRSAPVRLGPAPAL